MADFDMKDFANVTAETESWRQGDQYPIEYFFSWHALEDDDVVLVDTVDTPPPDTATAMVAQTLFSLPLSGPAAGMSPVSASLAQRNGKTVRGAYAPPPIAAVSPRAHEVDQRAAAAAAAAAAATAGATATAPRARRAAGAAAAVVVAAAAAAYDDDAADASTPRDKKDRHTDVEKRRRTKERETFVTLQQCIRPVAAMKLQRQGILDAAVDYIRSLEAALATIGAPLPSTGYRLVEHDDDSSDGEDRKPLRKRRKRNDE